VIEKHQGEVKKLENRTKKVKTKSVDVTVELQELKDLEWPNISAYAFSKSGRLIAKASLEQDEKKPGIGRASLTTKEVDLDLIIEVGPDIENANMLKKYKPAVKRLLEKEPKLKFEIVRPLWICWLKVPYHVTGSVKKYTGSPICAGEVDIYDVDIKYCIPWIPDIVIEKIRDGIIDVIVDPPPISPPIIDFEKPLVWWEWEEDEYCGTGPFPPIPPKRIDVKKKLDSLPTEWSFAKQRLETLTTARARMNTKLREIPITEQRAFLNTEVVEGVKVSQILYSNTNQFRKLIIDKFVVLRFFLCWWPWIYWLWWPYCGYALDKLGTAELQPDGSFFLTVPLSICRKDTPDLWFVVKQDINGVERVIYARHPVPCNTFWNHPSGIPVNLLVTDPGAIACYQPVPGLDTPYVLPMGIYEDEWYELDQAHIKSDCIPSTPLPHSCGLFGSTDPYGTRLDLRMQFHDNLRNSISSTNGARYYRWSFRKHGSVKWNHIITPIFHRHITKIAGKYFIVSKKLGPINLPALTEKNLFEVPDPNKSWLDNRNDLAYGIWYTAVWDGEKYTPQIIDGKYDLLLEMFDKDGNKLDPTAGGFKFALPTAPLGPLDDLLHVQDGGLILHVHVDNKDTVAEIISVAINGSKVKECQFLEYEDKSSDTVEIEYVAYHPTTSHNFLSYYNLWVKRGISGATEGSKFSTTPEPIPTTVSFSVQNLLDKYDKCAFAIWLHTYPRTRNGHGRIRAYEDSDSSAFALVKKTTS
jgi:hypothetical protein